MKVFAVVPVRGLRQSKSRLDPVMENGEREDLVAWMLGQVLTVLRESGVVERACVVSPDPGALRIADRAGAHGLRQQSVGLNPALEEARQRAFAAGAGALLVVPADLPLLHHTDIRELVGAAERCPAVIPPDDEERGTNALLLSPPDLTDFHFGPDSFHLHRRAAARAGVEARVVSTPGLAFDLDTPTDLARLRELERRSS